MALIARYPITSQEFFMHIEPYIEDKTRHFIHELYNFAISPHDFETYDRLASYSGPTDNQHLDVDNEVRIVEEAFERTRAPRTVGPESTIRNTLAKIRGLKKLVIKKNAQNNWELGESSALNLSNPGPSTSTTILRYSDDSGESSGPVSRPPSPPGTSSTYNFVPGSSSPIHVPSADDSDDEECQVVEVLKPKSERTPEIVDLSSDEEVLHTLINVSSGSAYSSPKYSPVSSTYSPTPPLYGVELSPTSSRDDSQFGLNSTVHQGSPPPPWMPQPLIAPPGWRGPPSPTVSSLHNTTEDTSSDVECVYNSNEMEGNIQPINSTLQPHKGSLTYLPYKSYVDNSNTRSASNTNEIKDIAQDLSLPKKKLSSAIVRPWAMNEAPSTSKPSKKKRKASAIPSNDATTSTQLASSSHMNDATTSEYSDNDSTDDRHSSPKKLKLRSVVAHFSFDSSEKSKDSSHRPHKKHKDKKKKKKKKHLHKRKHRVQSDTDSS